MSGKTLLGTVLNFSFGLAAYVTYVISILQDNKSWIVISALIYFLPLFVEFVEGFEEVSSEHRSVFAFLLICLLIGIAYIVLLLSYLSALGENSGKELSGWMRFFVAAIPIVCVPIKAIPLMVKIAQQQNRSPRK